MSQGGLERDIFGGSDDSDLSEDERQMFRNRKEASRSETPPARGDAGSDYNDEGTGNPPSSSLKFTKRKKSTGGTEGEGASGSMVPKKRRKRREKERKRLELAQKIDSIIKPGKAGKRKKRKKGGDEEEIDAHGDEEVNRLRQAMHAAADRDIEANANKQPAVSKLKMLSEVMDTLQKSSLVQSVLDNNLLEGVRRWLEPLPDKSLPALSIQNAFFEILPKLDIETAVLKESGLGRSYSFTLNANGLLQLSVRSASYRDRHVPTAETEVSVRTEKLNKLLERAATLSNNGRGRKNAVRIPESAIGRYTVAPKSGNAGVSANVAADVERRKANQERLRRMQRKLDTAKQKGSRA
ncbi:TFIIS helical bundle-like domain [Rhizoctonia solani]|uniref:TFIIS helical bundle-like domain n=1 Tax=Rhizoctonia solani TaxID=456999 RepID=A0A8H7I7J8_9AGAM|nr:TFIIS helical bundle-like domain [Rhizoctonia solani]